MLLSTSYRNVSLLCYDIMQGFFRRGIDGFVGLSSDRKKKIIIDALNGGKVSKMLTVYCVSNSQWLYTRQPGRVSKILNSRQSDIFIDLKEML